MVRSALALSVVVLVAGWAHAEVITIDGSDADWGSPDWSATDPVDLDSADAAYDIIWIGHEADTDQNRICFSYYTAGTVPSPGAGIYTRMLLDVDMNASTGGIGNRWSGVDYFIQWDYDNSSAPTAYVWNPVTSNFDLDNPTYIAAMKGDGTAGHPDNFVEFALSVSDTIGNENGVNYFRMVSALAGDRGVVDVAPDLSGYPGEEFSPEPTTLVLLPVGLAVFAAWRRRRAATEG
ncbi:PEP-CTERM sorting domain-containing protein [bacterium]|nr:PEP-CTERM sorting domain-containing protein [bacterium]